MNHSGGQQHEDHHGKGAHTHPPGWQRHSKWFVLAVVLMLVGMGVYVMTLDEEVRPPDDIPNAAERMPAAAP